MGRQGKGKKSEKVGSGKVTPVQVAFIVDRYLVENHYSKTLAEFRSEAASVLGTTSQPRQAPKSMLSLVDILDHYITLKEQRIALGQEKARIDQLLFSMQDIMCAYQNGGILPGSTTSNQFALANSSTTAVSPTDVTTSMPGSYPIPSTSVAITAPVAATALPVTNNKRKNSAHSPEAPVNPKKPCLAPVQSFLSDRNAQGVQNATNVVYIPSHARQAASHTSTYQCVSSGNGQPSFASSYSVPMPTSIAKTSYNQPSPAQGRQQLVHANAQVTSDSTCPRTPPQAFCTQAETSGSPLEASNAVNVSTTNGGPASNFSSSIRRLADGKEADQDVLNVDIISSKSVNVSANCATPRAPVKDGNSSKAPPSKLTPRKLGKRTHIKSRLDFNNSVSTSTSSPAKPSFNGTSTDCLSTCEPSLAIEMDGEHFDLTDFPIIDPDLDKFMSDFLADFQLDTEDLTSTVPLLDQTDEMSQSFEDQSCEMQTLVDSDSHPPKEIGVLTEKDMNIQYPMKANNISDSCTAKNTHWKGDKMRGIVDQENVPLL